jgi:hypothetical protein
MGRTARRLIVLGAVALAAIAAASCMLNPQPEPPSESAPYSPGTGGSMSGAGGSAGFYNPGTDASAAGGTGGGWNGTGGTGGEYVVLDAGSAEAFVPPTTDADGGREGDADAGDAAAIDGGDGAADAGSD